MSADTTSYYYSPLRYPGGKGKLNWIFRGLLRENRLCDSHYAEPFAGGAGVALALLLTEYVKHIYLNDISYPLYCFWRAILEKPDEFCRKLSDTPVTPVVWDDKKSILLNPKDYAIEEVGFALFFLNRTNHSGVLNAGMIGGRSQSGHWKIDARFNKEELLRRIRNIADHRHKITVFNYDAEEFLDRVLPKLPEKTFVYLDPPYYEKGQHLYENFYTLSDHIAIARIVQEKILNPWVVTYDYFDYVRKLYEGRNGFNYKLGYSARESRMGQEVMIFSDCLRIPEPLMNWEGIISHWH